jgi:hypothetical protein
LRPRESSLCGSRTPTVTRERRRAPAPRFGDPRVQALAGALCHTLLALTGITNNSLRALMTGLLATTHSINQTSYDPARLRHNQLIHRVTGRNLHTLTNDGLRFVLQQGPQPPPATAPHHRPQAPPELRAAFRTIDHRIHRHRTQARLPTP